MTEHFVFVGATDEDKPRADEGSPRPRGKRPLPSVFDTVGAENPEVEELPEDSVKVRVLPPFQVSHHGIAYWPEAVAEVPELLAQQWIRDGWVTDDVAN